MTAECKMFAKYITRSWLNLNQFFLVTVLMLPKNFTTIPAVVLELCCNRMSSILCKKLYEVASALGGELSADFAQFCA